MNHHTERTVYGLDLKSSQLALQLHERGQKHEHGVKAYNSLRDTSDTPSLDQDEFFDKLANGAHKNIVVVTGAGVSTTAGIPDFRSPGNVFDTLISKLGDRFPSVTYEPEYFLSASFVQTYPEIWKNDVWPLVHQNMIEGYEPTLTHRFVDWLGQKGWLRRVYTQNVDGLHSFSSEPHCTGERCDRRMSRFSC